MKKIKLLIFILLSINSIGVPATSYPDVSRSFKVTQDIEMFAAVLDQYIEKFGKAPNSEEGLDALVKANMLNRLPVDPWGIPYNYLKNNNTDYKIWTLGQDKRKGGSGVNYDFSTKTLKENIYNRQLESDKHHRIPVLYYFGILLIVILTLLILLKIRNKRIVQID